MSSVLKRTGSPKCYIMSRNAGTPLELRNVSVSYGAEPVIRRLSIEVAGGELMALLGPSGCGKTTVLKTIAGLLQPSDGEIHFGGRPVDALPPEKRGVALVFQSPLLFPHLDAGGNVAFGLRMRKLPGNEIEAKVAEALEMVRLPGFQRRRPSELSGGQEQRIALARALVTQPEVLLLDEPFSALDENLREEMRDLVRDLQRSLCMTTLFVTHDQEEAVRVADRIVLLLDGELAQAGPASDFYTHPRSPAVARFFKWQVFSGHCRDGRLETAAGAFSVPPQFAAEPRLTIAFRAENLSVAQEPSGPHYEIGATVREALALSPRIRYYLETASGAQLQFELYQPDPAPITPGSFVTLQIPASAVLFFRG